MRHFLRDPEFSKQNNCLAKPFSTVFSVFYNIFGSSNNSDIYKHDNLQILLNRLLHMSSFVQSVLLVLTLYFSMSVLRLLTMDVIIN